MASPRPKARRYATDELLSLRSSLPVVSFLVRKINKHPDIASICWIPDEALKNPEHFSYHSKELTDVVIRRKGRALSSKRTFESSEDSECATTTLTGRDRRQVQWNLRRRDSSDRSSQPHSAPSGIVAQKSENFQRFYRAVVSPTHVRVTAGGRIVPNTRAAAPPLFEWNSDKFHFEPRKPIAEFEPSQLQGAPFFHSPQVPAGYPPSIPGGFLPQYNFLPQGVHLGLAPMAAQIQPGHLGADINPPENAQLAKINGDGAGSSLQPDCLQQQVRISPPTQFDQTKPFVYNGHIVYPVPPGFHPPPSAIPLPITMLGNTNFLQAGPPTPNFLQTQFPVALPNLPTPMMFSTGQQFPMMMPSPIQPSENAPPLGPYLPFPSGTPISEVLQRQIHHFRNQLIIIDSQVASNLIDEAFAGSQRVAFLNQISNLETMLKIQLTQESTAKDALEEIAKVGATSIRTKSPALKSQTTVDSPRQPLVVSSTENFSTKQPVKTGKPESVQNADDAKSSSRSEVVSKSRLTIAAALAPPFQPRAQHVIAQAAQGHKRQDSNASMTLTTAQSVPLETQAQIEARLLAKSSTDWGRSGYLTTTTVVSHPSLSRAHTITERPSQIQNEGQPPTVVRSNTFHGQSGVVPVNVPGISSNAVPYLIGKLPHNIHASQAKPEDLIYPRPLTDEEIRARFLYWGKAPRSVQSGLPKFDGKDFYPPSPVKEKSTLAPVTPDICSSVTQVNAGVQLHDFDKLFTEPGVPGYKTPSPVRPAQDLQSMGPLFDNSIHGLGVLPLQSTQPLQQVIYHTVGIPLTLGHPTGSDSDDYSHLFMERGVPGYRSPSPPAKPSRTTFGKVRDDSPVTPQNPGFPEEVVGGTKQMEAERAPEELEMASPDSSRKAQSITSTVEIHMSPPIKEKSPKPGLETSFAERIANISKGDQQTLFLQNMLRKTTQSPMIGTTLSGTVSSATAQGYLPQYRGSAAASLAPTVLNIPSAERDSERSTAKVDTAKDSLFGLTPFTAANFLLENRPLSRDRTQRPIAASVDALDAEGYLRTVGRMGDDNNKDDVEQGWSGKASGSGPVMSSEW